MQTCSVRCGIALPAAGCWVVDSGTSIMLTTEANFQVSLLHHIIITVSYLLQIVRVWLKT